MEGKNCTGPIDGSKIKVTPHVRLFVSCARNSMSIKAPVEHKQGCITS